MGSVPDLYTSGDNDPELDPVAYIRHYLYCDACGSFELDPWTAPDDHEAIEQTRRRLARAALIASPFVVAAGWEGLGLFPSLVYLLVLAAVVALSPILRRLGILGEADVGGRWRFAKTMLLALPGVVVAEGLAEFVPAPLPAGAGLIFVAGLLIARAVLGSKIRIVGLRCRQCGSTYAYGTPFFTDLDANPRHRTAADVPRPLGSSPFQRGRSTG